MPIQPFEPDYENRIEKLKKENAGLKRQMADFQLAAERFDVFCRSMKEIYFECGLNGDLTYFSPTLCELTGYPAEELLGKNNREYTAPETAKRMFEIFNQVYRTSRPAEISDYEIFRKDGRRRYLELSAYLIHDEMGQPVGFRGIGRDVTDRFLMTKELRESQERFRMLNDVSFSGIMIHDNGMIMDCNAELCRMTGYAADELIGQNGVALLCAQESKKLLIQKIATGDQEPYIITALKKDGTRFPLEVQARNIPYRGRQVRVAEFRDITERKKAEQALRKSRVRYRQLYKESLKAEELYQSLLNSSADAILLLDADQEAQYINPAFTRIFGWTLEDLKGGKIRHVPRPLAESFSKTIEKIMTDGTPIQGIETQRYTRDGNILDTSISASRYLDHEGNPAGVVLILRDISEQKRYQWHMEQTQKMESIGTLAGGIAHDFNNLLMGIQGRLSLLMLNIPSSDKRHAHLKEMEDYIIRAADLTRQLLGIARSDKIEVKTTDIKALIQKHNRLFGRTCKEVIIHEDLAPSLSPVDVDQRQIEQVLLNIYVNASHAMPGGGDLFIRASNERLDSSRTAPYDAIPGQYIRLSITDTGTGMDEAVRKRIFEPFFTTKDRDRGTGLGLASAYGIIRNHGGFINVYTEKGKGSTFNIYIPASAKVPQDETIHDDEILEGEGTVLLVDDEEMIRTIAEEMIRALGYQVITAGGGQEAVTVFQERRNEIDLIILDLIMPKMGGSETFDRLRVIDPDAKILLSSGYSVNGEASVVIKKGCNDFIQKPFSIHELSKKIKAVLSSDQSGSFTESP
ncbi:MAG: PAS domain-containing sensor histidine kinase [Desulfobacteraceae bacterium]|jgi:PAS domain S-box-containing protein|nr:MAG: PAS domain-containing sensor histidine kinase [Desulfobacteraceae bacterium]